MTFKTTPVTIPLYGHGLETVGSIDHEPIVTGTFAADPVTGNDGTIFGVFTVPDPTNGKEPTESVQAACRHAPRMYLQKIKKGAETDHDHGTHTENQ